MKWLFILLFPMCVRAQDTTKHTRKGKWLQYALLTTSVVANAVGDGLNSREYYAQGHALNALSIGTLLAVPFVCKPNWKMPVNYILIRYAIFDGLYNYGAHRNLNYRGGQNYYNEGIGHVPLGVLNTTKFLSLGASILINIK